MSDAHNLYMAEACTLGTVALKGYIGIETDQSARGVSPKGDRKIQRQKTHTVAREETISIESEDIGARPTAGTVVALVATNARLVGGNDVDGTLLNIAAEVYIDSVKIGGLNQEGKPSLRISCTVHSADGIASGITITGAA
jgi:hypothetical protein